MPIAVFSAAAVLALSLVPILERPFDGVSGIELTTLRDDLELIRPGGVVGGGGVACATSA